MLTGVQGYEPAFTVSSLEELLAEGHNERAIARTAEKLQDLVDKRAESHTGSMEDIAFLTET